MPNMMKIFFILVITVTYSFGASEATVIFSKSIDKKYNEKIYRKTTILFTEARLKLQKRYKKVLNFIYEDKKLTNKKQIMEYLKGQNARYYVYLDVKEKNKCTGVLCKADYIIKVYDAKKKKNTKLKIKSLINNNEFVEISPALIKSNTKKLVKFLK